MLASGDHISPKLAKIRLRVGLLTSAILKMDRNESNDN